jgi:integrase
VAQHRLRSLVLVLGYCGLRIGEAAAVRVEDVDLSKRRTRVRRSVTYVEIGPQLRFSEPQRFSQLAQSGDESIGKHPISLPSMGL